jgi:deazaflavin-dependent oxidoreductase (nitroreductase family)
VLAPLKGESMVDQNERNRLLAEEFRAHQGQVDEDNFRGATLLLLTTKGRKSGRSFTNPMRYLPDGDRFIVFASHQGADEDPDWCKNLVVAGSATVEVGEERFEATAEVLEGSERDELYRRQAELHPVFGDYEKRTTRRIPVIALRRVESA